MAIRKIVTKGDPVLQAVCKPVVSFDEKLAQLLDDMHETLEKAQGLGLAAPQVGIRRRLALVDTGEEVLEIINPVILKKSGKQRDVEGCLSCPDEWGYVVRPNKCKIRFQDRNGEFYEASLTGLAARWCWRRWYCHSCRPGNGQM